MMYRELVTVALAVMALSPVSAAIAQSAFCGVGSNEAAMRASNPSTHIAALREKCRAGDTIFVPSNQTAVLGSVCDFSRAIVVAGRDALCVMANPRPSR